MGRFQAAATKASAAHCPSGPMKAMVLLSSISVIRRMARAVNPSFPTISFAKKQKEKIQVYSAIIGSARVG